MDVLEICCSREWWLDIPCYARLPKPIGYLSFEQEWGAYELPVVRVPDELIEPRVRAIGGRFYALLAFLAPPGTGKRIPADHMFARGLEAGLLVPGKSRVVEPTSGNMGLAMAYCARRCGIEFTAVVSDATPEGKVQPIRRQGANVMRESEVRKAVEPEASTLSPIRLSQHYAAKIGGICFNQYANDWNPQAYYLGAAERYWQLIGGSARFSVLSIGSGGTAAGLGRRWKELDPGFRLAVTMPYNGQEIGGTRSTERLRETKQPWERFADIQEPIDHRVAEKMSEQCDRAGFPIGASAAASIATANHLLSEMPEPRFAALRRDGQIGVMLFFNDTRYPYM